MGVIFEIAKKLKITDDIKRYRKNGVKIRKQLQIL